MKAKFVLIVFCILFGLFIGIAYGSNDTGMKLIVPGTIYDKGLLPAINDNWYGLYPSTSGFEAKKTKIIIKRKNNDYIISDKEGNAPFFFFKGNKKYKESRIKTVFNGNLRFNNIESSIQLKLDVGRRKNQYSLYIRGERKVVPHADYVSYENCKLVLSQGFPRKEQILSDIKIKVDNPVKLIWAGDLDMDGTIDLLLNLPRGDVGNNYVLYLSSLAEDGDIVKKSASYAVPGC